MGPNGMGSREHRLSWTDGAPAHSLGAYCGHRYPTGGSPPSSRVRAHPARPPARVADDRRSVAATFRLTAPAVLRYRNDGGVAASPSWSTVRRALRCESPSRHARPLIPRPPPEVRPLDTRSVRRTNGLSRRPRRRSYRSSESSRLRFRGTPAGRPRRFGLLLAPRAPSSDGGGPDVRDFAPASPHDRARRPSAS
jgi:hypothetical protein